MKIFTIVAALLCVSSTPYVTQATEHPAAAHSADEQVTDLEQMCEANAPARTERQTETTLYERLGKEKGIHRLTKEITRLHLQNDKLAHTFDGTDPDAVARHVADFMVSGLGGPSVYENRPTLTESHRHMKLTNADFMSAGGDVIQAMKNLEYGQNEIDDMVCTLVGLRDQVVLAPEHPEHPEHPAHSEHPKK